MSLASNHSLKMTAPAVTALSLVVPTVAKRNVIPGGSAGELEVPIDC